LGNELQWEGTALATGCFPFTACNRGYQRTNLGLWGAWFVGYDSKDLGAARDHRAPRKGRPAQNSPGARHPREAYFKGQVKKRQRKKKESSVGGHGGVRKKVRSPPALLQILALPCASVFSGSEGQAPSQGGCIRNP